MGTHVVLKLEELFVDKLELLQHLYSFKEVLPSNQVDIMKCNLQFSVGIFFLHEKYNSIFILMQGGWVVSTGSVLTAIVELIHMIC